MDLNFDPLPTVQDQPPLTGWSRWCHTYKTKPQHIVRCSCVEDTSATALFDAWSIVHVATGMLYSLPMFYAHSASIGFLTCFVLAVGWEVLENTECVRHCSKKAIEVYEGDNIWNSAADVVSCLFGFLLLLLIYMRIHNEI